MQWCSCTPEECPVNKAMELGEIEAVDGMYDFVIKE